MSRSPQGGRRLWSGAHQGANSTPPPSVTFQARFRPAPSPGGLREDGGAGRFALTPTLWGRSVGQLRRGLQLDCEFRSSASTACRDGDGDANSGHRIALRRAVWPYPGPPDPAYPPDVGRGTIAGD